MLADTVVQALLLDIDPHSGAVESFDYDDNTDTAILRRSADVQPIIDRNKELANHGPRDAVHGDRLDMRLAASIPIEVAYLWLQKYGICAWKKEHWEGVKRLLNDSEWRYLRCREFII